MRVPRPRDMVKRYGHNLWCRTMTGSCKMLKPTMHFSLSWKSDKHLKKCSYCHPNGWSLPVFHRGVGSGKCCSQNWEETKCSPGKGWEFDKLPNWTSTRPKESKKRIASVCFLFASFLSILFNCLFLFARWDFGFQDISMFASNVFVVWEVWNMLQPHLLKPSRWEMQSWNNLSHPSRIIIHWIYDSIIALYSPEWTHRIQYTRIPGPKSTRVYQDNHVVLH